jgi:hypothetical protein
MDKLLCNNTSKSTTSSLDSRNISNSATLSGVYGFHRSTIIELIDSFRKAYADHYQLIIGSDSLPVENLSSDIIYNCILFINSYTVTNGHKLIQHLKPRGVLCVIDPSGNDDIHKWLDNDYSNYRLVHQVFTYSDIPDEITPRIIWMTRRDVKIVKHSMKHKIKVMSTPQNSCQMM